MAAAAAWQQYLPPVSGLLQRPGGWAREAARLRTHERVGGHTRPRSCACAALGGMDRKSAMCVSTCITVTQHCGQGTFNGTRSRPQPRASTSTCTLLTLPTSSAHTATLKKHHRLAPTSRPSPSPSPHPSPPPYTALSQHTRARPTCPFPCPPARLAMGLLVAVLP